MTITTQIINSALGLEIKKDLLFHTLGLVDSLTQNTITFIDDERFFNSLVENNNIFGVFATQYFKNRIEEERKDIVVIEVDDPRYQFFSLQNYITTLKEKRDKFSSIISTKSNIHPTVFISDYNVIIKEGVIIEPNVTILPDVEIGKNTIIRSGSVIGSEGFEHKRTSKGILSVKHDGKVIIGNDVVIGALNSVSKGFSFRNTIIGDETKTDNLVHIAHGVQIGKRCFLPASCMIAGSCTLKDDVWVGPNASISSQITLENNSYVTIGSVVTKNVNSSEKVTGNFAIPHNIFLNNLKKSLNKDKIQ